jgi:hypothetical protein
LYNNGKLYEGWIKIMNNISSKIKSISVAILVISILIGVILLFKSVGNYINYRQFIDGASKYGGSSIDSYEELGNLAYSGKSGIIYSITILISGIISFFLLYGFGDLIERTENIDNNLEDIIKMYKEKTIMNEVKSKENITTESVNKHEMTRAELYDKLNNK